MNCTDTAEYVSALCDGETIPPPAAEHIGQCAGCQAKLLDYLQMGAELRRTASLEHSAPLAPLAWTKPQTHLTNWWQKGLATMRIPRLAFIVLIGAIIALASSLAVVKVHAHADGTVVLLSLSSAAGNPTECPLSIVDKQFQECGLTQAVGGGVLGFKLRLLSSNGGRIELGVRARQSSGPGQSSSLDDLVDRQPEQNYWFEPGDTLKIENPGMATLTVKGTWLDHVPSFAGTNQMDPGPGELRILSPLLLQDKQVIGDLQGASSTQTTPDGAVFLYLPRHGGFLIANSRIQDAVEALVELNRISFEENGSRYVILTSAPVTRAKHVWVLHRANFNPGALGMNADNFFLSSDGLRQTDSGTWVSTGWMH
jgi:hypothetical protein